MVAVVCILQIYAVSITIRIVVSHYLTLLCHNVLAMLHFLRRFPVVKSCSKSYFEFFYESSRIILIIHNDCFHLSSTLFIFCISVLEFHALQTNFD